MYPFAMTPESLSAAKFRVLDRLKRRSESRVHDLARELERPAPLDTELLPSWLAEPTPGAP